MSEKREKKRSVFFWILFGVIVPITVVGVIAVFILMMAGVDVVSVAKNKLGNTPVVSAFIDTNQEKSLKIELDKANDTISVQQESISDLENEITSLEKTVEDLEMDIKKQKQKVKSAQNGMSEEDEQEEIKKTAASFRKMEPEKAAQIVEQLDKELATKILSSLSGDVKGEILQEMKPKNAAVILERMAK